MLVLITREFSIEDPCVEPSRDLLGSIRRKRVNDHDLVNEVDRLQQAAEIIFFVENDDACGNLHDENFRSFLVEMEKRKWLAPNALSEHSGPERLFVRCR